VTILFNLTEDEDSAGKPLFVIDIYLLYSTALNPATALEAASQAKDRIQELFEDEFMSSGEWTEIELRACTVISEEALTYRMYRELGEWRFEQLSLESEPFKPLPK
jgi:hypothetical protein